MPNPKAIIGRVRQLDEAPALLGGRAAPIDVHFEDGRSGRIEPGHAHSAILRELQALDAPAYVEVEPFTRVITRVLIPLVVRVVRLDPQANGDLEVALEISHARHVLRRSHPDYADVRAELERALEDALPRIVSETDDRHEIIDVRPATGPPSRGAPERPKRGPAIAPRRPGPARARLVTPARATELFDRVRALSCAANASRVGCIPFLFPYSGCWARASEMCRIMISLGERPMKIWLYGDLRVWTLNEPACEVRWMWHVAPTLQLDAQARQLCVVDPSLFSEPVSQDTWVAAQGDPSATLAQSDASAYYRSVSGTIEADPTYALTERDLALFRLALRSRSATYGPPPYTYCL